MQPSAPHPSPSRSADLSALAFAVCFPSLLTFAYFVALAEAPTGVQQAVYAGGKIVQFAFPLVFVYLVARQRLALRWTWRPGLPEGIASGALIFVAIGLVWRLLEHLDSPLLATLVPNISAKVVDLGVGTPGRYVALAAFYSLVHTFLEEYYWRWFVFGRLRRRLTLPAAIALSSAGFMAHHVIVMGVYTGWTSPVTYLFSLAVAVGGAYWAWLYERSGTLVAPWVSHLFVDAAIFSVGWALVS